MNSTEQVKKAAKLLKIEPDVLSKCLLKHTVKYPGQTIEIEHSRDEATNMLNSLIKSIYSRLFTLIVAKVNLGIGVP